MKPFTQKQSKRLDLIAAKTPALLPFAADTPALKAERIRRATTPDWSGFSYFCSTYFPHIFTLPWAPAHPVMFRETEATHGVIAITGFRTLGKTVLMGVCYGIWKIILGERYLIHTAADESLASLRTMFTHHQLTHNRRILADFPELRPLDEDVKFFFLKNNTLIHARGIKQPHRGAINPKNARRPGLIICDDIDQEANIGNQTIGKRKLEKITQEIAGCLDPSSHGRVIWLGNLVHPNFAIVQFQKLIIDDIRADQPDFDPQHQSVIKTPLRTLLAFSLENPDGSSAWPEQYPTASLPDLRKVYGHTGYQKEMLGLPVIDGNIFKNEWFTQWRILPTPSQMKRVWLYCDPAWGKKGCFKAVIVIASDGYKYHVTHVWIRQTESTKLFRYLHDTFFELERLYRAKFRASIETTFGQARLLDDFDRWASDNGLPTISHRFKKIDNKEDKNLRIERMDTFIETSKVLFPQGQDMPTLLSQFLTYPDGYIDGPDAVAGCLERFTEYHLRNRVRVRRFKI